jgi:molybdenum cofactor cytidylyltransferase
MSDQLEIPRVTGIILAAGLSSRMGGYPKPLLPFGDGKIIDRIVTVLAKCHLAELIVVTGHRHAEIEDHLAGWPIRTVFNPQHASGEMLSSIQTGLRSASGESEAALIALGDQPILSRDLIEAIMSRYTQEGGGIVIPSFQRRRGHPILIGRPHWGAILELKEGQTLRDYLRGVGDAIHHVETDASSILRDLDTPEEYRAELEQYLQRQAAETQTPAA